MSKAASTFRRVLALDRLLRNSLTKYSVLVRCDEKTAPASQNHQEISKTKVCLALGICVCTRYRDSAFLFSNISMYFRKVFWNKRKEKKCSTERTLLNSYLVVLEFWRETSKLLPLNDAAKDGHAAAADEWDLLLHDSDANMQTDLNNGLESQLFFHIGRIDFRSWHFGVLQLQCTQGGHPCENVTFLEPHASVDSCSNSTYTDLEIFSRHMDLGHVWHLRFHKISMTDSDWISAPPSSIAVRLLESTGSFIVWQGSAAEKERRRLKEASQTKKRTRDAPRPPAKRSRKQGRKKTGELKTVGDKQNDDQQDGDLDVDEGPYNSYNYNPLQDDVANLLVPNDYDCFQPGGAFADDEDETHKLEEQCQNDEVGNDEVASECASPNSILDEFLDSADELEPEQQNEGQPGQPEQKHETDDLQVAPPEVPPRPVEPPEETHREVHRPTGLTRSTLNRTVFEVSSFGELHYYHTSEQMVAFCPLRSSSHPGCRKQMTTNPKKKGSGRPIGALVAWLRMSHEHGTKLSHVKSCTPTYQERVEARKFFEGLPGADSFAKYEKKKGVNEDSEPKTV